jgi:CRP-like cAMP-binding protein
MAQLPVRKISPGSTGVQSSVATLKSDPQQPALSDGRLTFNASEQIFSQGEPGGDLFFIEDGIVEIYQIQDGQEIVLSEMSKGEIIGVMTCMTREPRMASARAKTWVSLKKVPHESIRKVFGAQPNWMKIVFKEFSHRLTQTNKLYSDAVLRVKQLEENQVSYLYRGALFASAFGHLAELLAVKYEDSKIVVIDDAMQKLEFALNIPRDELDKIFTVLSDSGLIKVEIEPERKRNVVKLEVAQKVSYFAQFVKESKHGASKKLVRARFSNKEFRVLSALVKYAVKSGHGADKPCQLAVKELEEQLDKKMAVKFDMESLKKAHLLKLLEVKGANGQEQVSFRPGSLGRTITCIEAVRRLQELDTPEQQPSAA